jgi:host factor-I protein
MDPELPGLQNDFFNTARKEKSIVTVFLGNGKRLTGRLKSFDKYTLLLEGHQGEQIIFKHAISTVSTNLRPAEGGVGEHVRGRAAPVVDQQPVQRAHD